MDLETKSPHQLGPEHDPEPRHASARFAIDQEPLPGF